MAGVTTSTISSIRKSTTTTTTTTGTSKRKGTIFVFIILCLIGYCIIQIIRNESSSTALTNTLLLLSTTVQVQQQKVIDNTIVDSTNTVTSTSDESDDSDDSTTININNNPNNNNNNNTTTTTTTTTAVPKTVFTKLAVLVEPFHKLPGIEATITNALDNLPNDWQVVAFLPQTASNYMISLCNVTNTNNNVIIQQGCYNNRLRYVSLANSINLQDTNIYNVHHWRNQLFINHYWWESLLPAQWVLMIQIDTIICQKNKQPDLRFPYIGGGRQSDIYNTNILLPYIGHMNGGFSIRNVVWTINCLKNTISPLSNGQYYGEDTVFEVCHTETYKNYLFNNTNEIYKVPTYQDVVLFASDNGHTGCLQIYNTSIQRTILQCPYGLHKPWAMENITKNTLDTLYSNCPGAENLLSYNTK